MTSRKSIRIPRVFCRPARFLAAHQIQGKECLNTALAAKMAAERQDPAVGAIASTEAAKLYDLDVLAPSIENDKSNHTRFINFWPRTRSLAGC
mgnify:CR=1 FL=1